MELFKPHPESHPAAVKVGRINGRNWYNVPVHIRHNSSKDCCTVADYWVITTAHSAADAANYVRDQVIHIPETEITAVGAKGGKVERYIGWYSSIANSVHGSRDPQLKLALEN